MHGWPHWASDLSQTYGLHAVWRCKNMFFLPLKYFMKYFSFLKVFFKYFILPDTAVACKKIKLCVTVYTVNG